MKRRAFLIHCDRGESWEFYGVYPQRRPEIIDRLAQLHRAYTEERYVTRYQLEEIKEDEVTDEEWAEYQEVAR